MASDKSDIIVIASDHNGNAARRYIVRVLDKNGYNHMDMGPTDEEGKVDYVDYAQLVCETMAAAGPPTKGILICGTGSGMCIAANRFRHVRAALVTDKATAILSREHNDANVLVLGQWRTSLNEMEDLVLAWLETPFEGGRHVPRLQKLARL